MLRRRVRLLTPTPSPLPHREGTFGSVHRGGVRRTVSWRAAIVVALGGSLLVVVSLGPMTAALGPVMVVVWAFTACVGALQCAMLGELGTIFPDKVGGTATYAHEALKHISPLFGAASNWGYWLAWTPGVAVNCILAAGYLRAAFLPAGNTLAIALGLGLALYALNWYGLKPSVRAGAVMAVCALVPLLAIVAAPLFRPPLFEARNLIPFAPRGGSWASGASWLLIAKWMFVAVWSSYGMEMASTVIAEMRDPQRGAPKAMAAAAGIGVAAYSAVPFVFLGIVGVAGLDDDPSVALLPASAAIFGVTGSKVIALMLIAALVLGAQAFIIGSSRTIYQMSRDGLTLRQFGALNHHGVPVGSVALDALVTGALLLLFGVNVVDVVAAANVGYLVVFMLLPVAYLALRRAAAPQAARLPGWFVPIAVAVLIYNWLLFFVGAAQWGAKVMGAGIAVMLVCLPLYAARRWQDARCENTHRAA